jgi:glycosyltransferase involved in cell wall biosynthesis
MVVFAQAAKPTSVTKLSVIMPVYNEYATASKALEALLSRSLPGLTKEVIVVESNSSDGTRDLVLRYRDHPEVNLVLQEQARGKGNAVRAGLKVATGDIVLIQDADLEYDLDDYDQLLEPLLTFRTSFVLGSRHSRGWKIRVFNDQPVIAGIFNLGHMILLGFFNLLYRRNLRDPFTMFKVFRTDCLHGLRLECDRFDFDLELVIKLIRKGYLPVEIPVNYRARSFSEGKKVSPLRDPLTWVRAMAKYRFVSILDDSEAQGIRAARRPRLPQEAQSNVVLPT